MPRLRFELGLVLPPSVAAAAWVVNEWLFPQLEFIWASIGCTLHLQGALAVHLAVCQAGAVGLLLVSWLVCFSTSFPDPLRFLLGGILASAAPWSPTPAPPLRYGGFPYRT